MANIKFSQIAVGAAPASTDQVLGITGGTTDNLYTVAQVRGVSGGAAGQIALFGSPTTITSGIAQVGLTQLPTIAIGAVLGNNTAAPATPIALLPAQFTALIQPFTAALAGDVPASGGGTTNFLRADGTWQPAGGGASLPIIGTGATVTTSQPLLDLSQTWNAGAVAFTGMRLNVTNTASAAASALLDLQAGGSSLFSVSPPGKMNLGPPASAYIFDYSGVQQVSVTIVGTAIWGWSSYTGSLGLAMASLSYFGWANNSGGNYSNNIDLALWRDGPQILAQHLGTFAQTFRVYNTITDASNYERGVFDWTTTANVLTIGPQAAGTGTLRSVTGVGNWSFPGSTNIGTLQVVTGGISLSSNNNVAFAANTLCAWGGDAGLQRIAPAVLSFSTGFAATPGWYQWAGQARVTSDFSVTSSVALVNVTGLSVTVAAGRTYFFESELYVTDAAAGGVKAAIAGTATATAIQYTGYTIADNAIKGKANSTALAGTVGSTTTTELLGIVVRITGTITVLAAGTLTVQMAQNTSSATATVAKQGSFLLVYDMP